MLKLLLQLFKTGAVVDTVQLLFQSKIENIRTDIYKKLANVLASIVLMIIISFVGLIMLLFLGFGLSFYLNLLLDSSYLGFLIVGGMFFIATWAMSFTIRTGYMQKKLYQIMLNILEKRND